MSNSNIYVGIDLHKQNFNYVMMNRNGKIIDKGKRTTSVEDVRQFGSSLNRNYHVVAKPIGRYCSHGQQPINLVC